IPLPTHGSHASATGRRPAYFFFRRTLRPFRATLSIANSSSLRPCLMRAESHRGRAPRPAHVSPPGPRYLGGTLRPFSAERRPNPVRKLPAARPLSAPRRESCFSSSLRFSLSLLSMSARSASNASTSIPFRLIAAIRVSHSYTVELDRTIQSKAKASTPKWHTWRSTLRLCVFSSGSPPRATYDHSEEAAAAAARRPCPARSDVNTADAPRQIDECRRDAALQTLLARGCGLSATQRHNLCAVTPKSSTAAWRLVKFQAAIKRVRASNTRSCKALPFLHASSLAAPWPSAFSLPPSACPARAHPYGH